MVALRSCKKTANVTVLFSLGLITRYEEARNSEAYHGIVKSKGSKENESAKYRLISGLYLSIVLQCILLVFLVLFCEGGIYERRRRLSSTCGDCTYTGDISFFLSAQSRPSDSLA